MHKPPIVAPASLLAGSLAWAAVLTTGESVIGSQAAWLLAFDLILITAVDIVGLLLSRTRWTVRFAYVVIAGQVAAGLVGEINTLWTVAMFLTGFCVVAVAGPWLDRWISKRPNPSGPPRLAVALVLALLVGPAVLAVSIHSPISWLGWTFSALSFGTAWAYGRAMTIGLWSARVVVPLVGVASILLSKEWTNAFLAVWIAAVIYLAWRRDVQSAVQALEPVRDPAVPILPELAPADVRTAVGHAPPPDPEGGES